MAEAPILSVSFGEARIREFIRDAVREAMALPVCDREHVEPMAEWERELLSGAAPVPCVPRVATSRNDFRTGQLVALTMPGCEAIAKVIKAEGGEVHIKGEYLHWKATEPGSPRPPMPSEIDAGHWLILTNPQERG